MCFNKFAIVICMFLTIGNYNDDLLNKNIFTLFNNYFDICQNDNTSKQANLDQDMKNANESKQEKQEEQEEQEKQEKQEEQEKQEAALYDKKMDYYDKENDYDYILNNLPLRSVDEILNRQGFSEFSFSKLVKAIAKGDKDYIKSTITKEIRNNIFEDYSENKKLMLEVIVIVLIGTVFSNISNSLGDGFISENGFYITYMLLTSVLLASYFISVGIVESCMTKLIGLLKIIIPIYGLAMNYVGQSIMASGMYQVVMLGILVVEFVIKNIVLVIGKYYVMVTIINNINKLDRFSKLTKFLKQASNWILKTSVVVIIGFNIVKNLINPELDAIGRDTVKRVISVIPGGNMINMLSGTLLGSGIIIKNCIGVTGMLLIIFVVAFPVIRIFILMLMVRFTMIIIQPLGEKRYVNAIEALAGGMDILLNAMISGVAMFLLTIAIMAYGGRG